MEMVRGLKGPAFLLWRDVLTDRVTAGHREVGAEWAFSVTGREPHIPLHRLGLRGTRPGRVREQLEAYAAQGSAIAGRELGLEMRVEDRSDRRKSHRGLKVVLRRVARQVAGRGASDGGSKRVKSRQEARQVAAVIERESDAIGGVIGGKESLSEVSETLSASAETGAPTPSKSKRRRARRDEPPDVAALLERWPRVAARQRRSLEEIAGRHDVTGREWAAAVIRDTPEGADPFATVMEADKAWQRERSTEVEAAETAWAADKDAEAKAAPSLAETLAEHGADLPDFLRPTSPESEEE